MAFPTGGGKTTSSAPAAPTSYPVLSLAGLKPTPSQTGSPARSPSLATTAAWLANQDYLAQAAAIRQQQAADNAEAATRARLINRASTAAANYLGPGGLDLAGATKQDYADAVAQTQGLASGYSDQFRQAAAQQAGAANAQLGSIVGNDQHVTSQGGSLADLLYGLRGVVPGTALATEGLGATAAARTLGPAVRATGLNEALGVIGAGRADARALDPQLATARGNISANTQKYLGNLISQQVKIQSANDLANYRAGELALGKQRVDASVAEANARIQAQATYQAAYLQHLQAGDTERVAHDKAMEAAGEAYHTAALGISRYNAQTSRINAATARINANKPPASSVTRPTANAIASRSAGVLSYVGSDGQIHPILTPNGKTIPYVGGSSSTSANVTPDAKLAKAHGLSVNELNGYTGTLQTIADIGLGRLAPPTTGTPPLTDTATYQQALAAAARQGVPPWLAQPYLTRQYAPVLIPQIQAAARASFAAGHPLAATIRAAVRQGGFPAGLARFIIKRVYKADQKGLKTITSTNVGTNAFGG